MKRWNHWAAINCFVNVNGCTVAELSNVIEQENNFFSAGSTEFVAAAMTLSILPLYRGIVIVFGSGICSITVIKREWAHDVYIRSDIKEIFALSYLFPTDLLRSNA